MIKGIERLMSVLIFEIRGVEFKIYSVRQDVPPKMGNKTYEFIVKMNEPDHRLELLHKNVRNYGTVFNTVLPGTSLNGTLVRK